MITAGVKQVEFYPDQEAYFHNNNALFKVVFEGSTYDDETKTALDNIKLVLVDHGIYLRGETVNAIEYNNVL